MIDRSYWEQFIPGIYSPIRKSMKPKFFPYAGKIVSLNFLFAGNYFINEYGQIWRKDKLKFTRSEPKYLVDGHLPLVNKDWNGKYPWVLLPVPGDKIWLPINLILGWAFIPPKDNKLKYFNFKDDIFIPGISTVNDGEWSAVTDNQGNNYNELIKDIYTISLTD